jgi:hypothetical protein
VIWCREPSGGRWLFGGLHFSSIIGATDREFVFLYVDD